MKVGWRVDDGKPKQRLLVSESSKLQLDIDLCSQKVCSLLLTSYPYTLLAVKEGSTELDLCRPVDLCRSRQI